MKKNIIFAMASLCGALLWACSDDSPSQPELHSSLVCSSQEKCSDVTLQEGLALIRSSGKFAEMGTNSNSAKPSERPQMDAKFAYDFQIGKHEVTCGEFNALMDKKNGVKLSCENENLPAVNTMPLSMRMPKVKLREWIQPMCILRWNMIKMVIAFS